MLIAEFRFSKCLADHYRVLLETRALQPEKGLWLGEDFLMSIVQL